MKMDKKDDKGNGMGEDTTQYGEFISSFDAWIPPEEQKRKAKKLEDATNKNNTYKQQK